MYNFVKEEKKAVIIKNAKETLEQCNALESVMGVFDNFDGKVFNKRFSGALEVEFEKLGYSASVSKTGNGSELQIRIFKAGFYSNDKIFYVQHTGYGVNHGEECTPINSDGRISAKNARTIINQALEHERNYANEIISTDFDKLNSDIVAFAIAYNKIKNDYNYTALSALGLYPELGYNSNTIELRSACYSLDSKR